jgi:hypothetical protein
MTVSWTMPTAYEDGTALPLASIKATEVQWGTCGTGNIVASVLGTVSVPAPAAQTTITSLVTGTYCAKARVVDILNTAGTWAAAATNKVILQVPKAPVVVIR